MQNAAGLLKERLLTALDREYNVSTSFISNGVDCDTWRAEVLLKTVSMVSQYNSNVGAVFCDLEINCSNNLFRYSTQASRRTFCQLSKPHKSRKMCSR